MKRRTILVLGGALSGPTAAARAREMDEGARIVLIEKNRNVSYAQCGLAYRLSGEVTTIDELNREKSDFFRAVYDVEVWTETEAIAVDPEARTLTVKKKVRAESVSYDALVVALGAASRLPENLPGKADNLVCFRTLADLETIERVLSAGGRRLTVIGGGPMGIEAADGLIRRDAEVTLIERQDRVLNVLGPRVSAIARRALERHARIITNAAVHSFESREGRITGLRLTNGERVDMDLVISAIGLSPRTELLRAAGAKVAQDGTLIIDERCQTTLSGVFACGVCVSVSQAITNQPVWWPQGALADKTAQVAGANAACGEFKLSPALGSMLVRVSETTVGRVGLSESQAVHHFGPNEIGVTSVHAPSHDRYFPQSALLFVQMIWRRSDGRILGVEVAGNNSADKRVDGAAGAIASGMTVSALAAVDFGYEPPFNAARDPLNVAATVAAFERAGIGRSMEPEELSRRLGSVQVVDVRSQGANELPPVDGSIAIPLELLRQRLDTLDRSRPVVTVSENGRRGWLAARILAQTGFPDVANLAGGLRALALTA